MRLYPRSWLILGAALALPAAPRAAPPDPATARAWISEMKAAARGPFSRIRWFCKDGSVLPPGPYACRSRGGGSQHGEWTDRVRALRAAGYFVATVYADLDAVEFARRAGAGDHFAQLLVERFLVGRDDGWILRRARFYRGALQEEGERRGGRRLLFKLAEDPVWLRRRFLALRTGVRLIPHGADTASVSTVRELSADLAGKDPEFVRLRNKIHVAPEAADAAAVRGYAARAADPAARAEYERLAASIDRVYRAAPIRRRLEALASRLARFEALAKGLRDDAVRLGPAAGAAERLAVTGRGLARLRDRLTVPNRPRPRVAMLDASLALEAEHFKAGTELRARLAATSREEGLRWLGAGVDAAYGTGLVSRRERAALRAALERLRRPRITLRRYKEGLDYLARVPGWSAQWLRFHFQPAMEKLAEVEPLAGLFIQDALRGGPLFFYAAVLDRLLRDANRLAGVRHELFGEDVGAGLRSLNPGLARGRLGVARAAGRPLRADGIYLLPETVSDLPPVAGILTAGAGNPLSHVQLLARNLGIPNVAVDESLIASLARHDGERVVLAVSPAGSVRLAADEGAAAEGEPAAPERVVITPDLDKLDLTALDFVPLSRLRARDSGRTVGPKAAKLGELRYHFPEAVADGLAIPFGRFRRLLAQPFSGSGQSVFQWMVGQYRALERLPAGSEERAAATEAFRAELAGWITRADPGDDFRRELRAAMARVFGADGTYGVFVRSDTNVEDLPGFTGAGLNLTVPNVVGFDRIMVAISRVWASPFSARAFAWRQARMRAPEHVYPAVLLLKSVPSEKSGVLVTRNIDTGAPGWLSVAVNEGVGGAVDGQAAESLRINAATGGVRLLAPATARVRRVLAPGGGIEKVPVIGGDAVLEPAEIEALIGLYRELPRRFPAIVDAAGDPAPADVEFGFVDGRLVLFQIRPFLESRRARGSAYLASLDRNLRDLDRVTVDLAARPQEGRR